jgi:hypothetical protein
LIDLNFFFFKTEAKLWNMMHKPREVEEQETLCLVAINTHTHTHTEPDEIRNTPTKRTKADPMNRETSDSDNIKKNQREGKEKRTPRTCVWK